jgi:MFS superfamily sulfate permease-like transporter
LAAFIAGGWLIIEFVDRILVAHYHFPDKTIDITFITLLCTLICTLIWRWFSRREKPRKFKLELVLIRLVVLITVLLDCLTSAIRSDLRTLGSSVPVGGSVWPCIVRR